MTTDALPSVAPVSEANRQRRALLPRAAQAVGGVGVVAAAMPCVASFEPSARALAEGGPVEAS